MKNPVNIRCPTNTSTSGYVKYGINPNTRIGICRNGNAIKSPIPSIFLPMKRYPNPQIRFKSAFLNFIFIICTSINDFYIIILKYIFINIYNQIYNNKSYSYNSLSLIFIKQNLYKRDLYIIYFHLFYRLLINEIITIKIK